MMTVNGIERRAAGWVGSRGGLLFLSLTTACLPLEPTSPVADAGFAQNSDAGPTDGGQVSAGCDNSTPSQTVDRYVWGEAFIFNFTPAGDNIRVLYVPANAMVNFKLAGSDQEEVHTFKITIPGCESAETGLGTTGNPSQLQWKAPKTAGTYVNGIGCLIHPGMEANVVVSP